MGLFSKSDNVPRIPPAPVLPELPKREKASELPSLPGNPSNDNLNRAIIKSAINDSETPEVDEVDEDEVGINPIDERIPLPPSYSDRLREVEGVEVRPGAGGTIFVKIDKFHRAQGALRDIEDKVREISSEVNTLREVKIKEIKELEAWDDELKKINGRLSKIDSSIFGGV